MKPHGYTLIELLVALIFAAAAVATIGTLVAPACGSQDMAKDSARQFAQELYPNHDVQGVVCVNVDTDGNGYVSCSVTVREDSGTTELLELECSSVFIDWFNKGCRVARPNLHHF